MLNRKFFTAQLFILISLSSWIHAQSNSFNITWTPGTENDLLSYSVYRSTLPNATTKIADVNHPTSNYRDSNIQRGVRYYYRLKAVNNAYAQSDYSEEVSAAIPLISGMAEVQEIAASQSLTIPLDTVVMDPDGSDQAIVWTVSGQSRLNANIQNRIATITAPSDWVSEEEQLTFTATDVSGFYDLVTITFTTNSSGGPNSNPPILSDLPSISLEQNQATTVSLGQYVFDPDNNNSELLWDFSNYSNLTISFNDNTDVLTITAPTDWSGFEYIDVTVSDPGGASDSDTLVVRVTGAQLYPPQISNVPTITIEEDNQETVALNDYVTDADDPVQNLFWHAQDNPNITIQINHNSNVARFIPNENWYGSESVLLYVSDPNQQSDSTLVNITVTPVNDRPVITLLPSLNLSEQLSAQINLANYSSDIDDAMQNLSWSSAGTQNVSVDINNSTASFSVQDSWFGQETISIFVMDDQGAKDTSSVTVYRQNLAVAPVISGLNDVSFDEDNNLTINLNDYVSDNDNADSELAWSVSNNNHISVKIDQTTHSMLLDPAANWNGSEEISLRVSDPNNNVDFTTMEITVNPVNDLPEILPIGTISILENTVYTLDLDDYLHDADGIKDIVDITILSSNDGFIGHFINMSTYQITFFAPSGYFGRETFLLRASDSNNENVSTAFSVNVPVQNIAGSVQVAFFGSETNCNLSWTTVIETMDYIEYGLNTAYGLNTETDDDFLTQHEHILGGLTENTTYHYRIVSQDSDGKISYSKDALFTTGSGDEINVFPIPYQASKDMEDNGIYFTNLPENSQIDVYNLLGEPVYKKDKLSNVFRWPVKNNAGRNISSGLYVYIVKDEKNKKVTSGKLIVVR